MSQLPQVPHENLLVGTHTSDDAGVYKINDHQAVIQTIDVFTPIVDDPYLFGQIAAANALSDVYAMGGKPITALNFIGFPVKAFPLEVMVEILKGGSDKVQEAGAIVIGGHSVEDAEPKYGLAVTGMVHPERVITNARAQVGDVLILTKPLGTGIVTTAIKMNGADSSDESNVIRIMSELNAAASELMQKHGAHACTDITGNGLLGHGYEMAAGSNAALRINAEAVPLIDNVITLCKAGFIPRTNEEYLGRYVKFADSVESALRTILFDPQTSGGLLIAISKERSALLLKDLHSAGVTNASIIGEVIEGESGTIEVC